MLLAAGAASATEALLYDRSCVRGAASLEEARGLEVSDLECSNHRYETHAPYVRLHAEVDLAGLSPNERLFLQTDSALFERIVLRFSYQDGAVEDLTVSQEDVSKNWFADNRFSVPIPQSDQALQSVDAVVVRPWSQATLTDLRIIEREEAISEQFAHSLIHVLVVGLLVAALFFDVFYFRLLRARFIVWHAALAFALLIFVVSNSGLIYEAFPGLTLYWRFFLNTFALVALSIFASFFLLSILEDHVVPRWLRVGILAASGLALGIKLLCLLDTEEIRQIAHSATLIGLVPLWLLNCAAVFYAVLRKDRLWPYLAISWGAMIVAALFRMNAYLGLTRRNYLIDDALLASTAVLALGTAAAVASRMMALRTERDNARRQAIEMGKMAMTDPLTGLANRRAFERMTVFNKGQGLLLLDIDRFKSINDTFGHATGDRVLVFAAQAMRSCFRDAEFDAQAFRIGGEEFAIILCCSDEHTLRAAGERLRTRIEQGPNQGRQDLPNVTASIGAIMGQGLSRTEALERADAALYEAKREGRNAVRLAAGLTGLRPSATGFGIEGEGRERPH